MRLASAANLSAAVCRLIIGAAGADAGLTGFAPPLPEEPPKPSLP